jgi:hypothetical protein
MRIYFILFYLFASHFGANAQAIVAGNLKSLAAGAVMPAYTAVYVSSVDNRAYPAQRDVTANNAVAITTVEAAAIGDSIQIIYDGTIYEYSGSEAEKNFYLGTTDGLVTEFVPSFGVVQQIGRQVGKNLIIEVKTAYQSGAIIKDKTADETRVSNTTLTADATLTASLDAGCTYRVKALLLINIANANMDYKYSTAYSGTASGQYYRRQHVVCGATTTVSQATTGAIPSTAVAGTTSGHGWVLIEGTITTTTSGTWSVLWAQNASDVGQIISRTGSYIEVKRIL